MIGILDWGIGSLFTVRALREAQPQADLVVLSDAGNVPYGRQSRPDLHRSVVHGLDFLRSRGATRIVVACHSASTVLPELHAPDTVGVVAPEHVPRGGRILVVGGERTIRSQVWRKALAGHGTVVQRIAQPLSAAVEAGALDTEETRELVRQIVAPVPNADTVVLACTHYIALRPLFEDALPEATFVDPALERARRLPVDDGHGHLRVYTTGDTAAMTVAMQRHLSPHVAPGQPVHVHTAW